MIRLKEIIKEGTPCAVKVACTVWSGGKLEDNLKELPITIYSRRCLLNCKVFDRSVNHEYTFAKLMEHAWWQNTFVNAFSEFLYKNPGRVCWTGDYATESDDFNFNLPAGIVRPNYKKVWCNRVTYLTCQPSDFTLDNKFLINYDTSQFIDLNEYKAESVNDDGWIIHPLPLLTAVGNGRGGGDFQDGVGIEFVGTWAWHLLAFLDSPPKDFLKADIAFVEQR